SLQGRCNRDKPPCKYFHPPQHLKDQLLINGRNHLALKNALMQQMGIAPGQPVLSGQVPTVATSPYMTGIPANTYSPYYAAGHLVPTLLGPDPTAVASQLGPVVPQTVQVAQQKIPRSDRLEVCREFLRGACKRAESECRFAHPQESVARHDDGSITVCMDAVKGRCARDPCRYFHPPLHLQAQLKAAQTRATAVAAAAAMDVKTVGSFYYENFQFSGMVPFKRPAAEKSGIPVYQPGATTYQQLMQPYVPVSCEYPLQQHQLQQQPQVAISSAITTTTATAATTASNNYNNAVTVTAMTTNTNTETTTNTNTNTNTTTTIITSTPTTGTNQINTHDNLVAASDYYEENSDTTAEATASTSVTPNTCNTTANTESYVADETATPTSINDNNNKSSPLAPNSSPQHEAVSLLGDNNNYLSYINNRKSLSADESPSDLETKNSSNTNTNINNSNNKSGIASGTADSDSASAAASNQQATPPLRSYAPKQNGDAYQRYSHHGNNAGILPTPAPASTPVGNSSSSSCSSVGGVGAASSAAQQFQRLSYTMPAYSYTNIFSGYSNAPPIATHCMPVSSVQNSYASALQLQQVGQVQAGQAQAQAQALTQAQAQAQAQAAYAQQAYAAYSAAAGLTSANYYADPATLAKEVAQKNYALKVASAASKPVSAVSAAAYTGITLNKSFVATAAPPQPMPLQQAQQAQPMTMTTLQMMQAAQAQAQVQAQAQAQAQAQLQAQAQAQAQAQVQLRQYGSLSSSGLSTPVTPGTPVRAARTPAYLQGSSGALLHAPGGGAAVQMSATPQQYLANAQGYFYPGMAATSPTTGSGSYTYAMPGSQAAVQQYAAAAVAAVATQGGAHAGGNAVVLNPYKKMKTT
ncbi:hypothetical protein KR222_002866, partial [Zaprionus bogoriensis]